MNVESKVNKITNNNIIDTSKSRVLSKLKEYDDTIKKIEQKDVFKMENKNHTNTKIIKKNNKNKMKKNKSFP
jgi:hypothetical protein